MSTLELLSPEAVPLSAEAALSLVMADTVPALFAEYETLRRRAVVLGGPQVGLAAPVNDWREENLAALLAEIPKLAVARLFGIAHFVGSLSLEVIRGETGEREPNGLASLRVVTDVGCQKIVAAMNTSDAVTFPLFKYHALGTGTNAEAVGDTALQTELTTEYVSNQRALGSQTTGGNTKTYLSVATVTLDSGTPAVTEHGLLSQQATGGGSLFDRTVFAALNLVGANGDSVVASYSCLFASGG